CRAFLCVLLFFLSSILLFFSLLFFFFYCSPAHRALHSFPTRRSSDLGLASSRGASSSEASMFIPRVKPSAASFSLISLSDFLPRSEEHTSELQSPYDLVCRLLLEKKKKKKTKKTQRSSN